MTKLLSIVIYFLLSNSILAITCEGNSEDQLYLGQTALKTNTSINFGYLCEYSNPVSPLPKYHAGVDYSGSGGQQVYAPVSGNLKKASTNYYGSSVYIVPDNPPSGLSIRIYLLHLEDSSIVSDRYVNKNDPIAKLYSYSSSHLHIEVRLNYSSTFAIANISCPDGNCNLRDEIAGLTVDPGILVSGSSDGFVTAGESYQISCAKKPKWIIYWLVSTNNIL